MKVPCNTKTQNLTMRNDFKQIFKHLQLELTTLILKFFLERTYS